MAGLYGQLDNEDYLVGGHAACAGCGAALGLKLALKALNGKCIVVNASGCMTLLGVYPLNPLKVPWIHSAIENAGATATGVCRALKKQGRENSVHVLVYAGDGATYDIGLQSLSSAIERGEDFVYVCYNNEAFGNTGMQKSAATPRGAITSTSPKGKVEEKKNIEKIISAHGCYTATASVSHPFDFVRKVQKAAEINGPAFINLLTPCTTGWKYEAKDTIEVGRKAVDSGYWELYEIVKGEKTVTVKPQKETKLADYLKMQKRFTGENEE
ncbi:pyruvate synthase subunit beta [Candidatus Micrarchaeota archaeon]|nr:pyruvate synthase subunit beta [Candidatus Micrarchaeota archaeon]